MNTTSIESLLDSAELAALLSVPERTIAQWAYRGVGPSYVKVGRHRRYRPEDVERWLELQTRGGPDAAA